MATLYTEQDRNIHKTWLLMTGFLVFIIGATWIFSQAYGNSGILYFGVAFAFLMNFFSYWYSHKIVLAMSGAQPISENENRELYRLVENLSITAGLPMPKLYIINDLAPNAFATGRDPKHAVIAVTSGLLNQLERSEIEGVLAHELSHIGNRDILLSTIIVMLVGFVSLISDWFWRISFYGGRNRDNKGIKELVLIIAIVLAIFAPIVGSIIHLAISRKREFLADASGALLTRYPDGLASALERISSYPISIARANHATAHLYIISPFKGKEAVGFLAKLFMTHPPIEERIKILRGMNI
ncbi:MAG: Protease HtpX-like protein [Parcubacteria group bacterium GW2011_GWD2_38_12]|nr:MAG: Protease HtpX-like protein [Parcubacteria group bacterium GW2011_GWC2_36_17]KKQ42906.1 MAG: Protease HtpX-like protein [Parcubacteria group bacterium GW2011_GWE2_37_8]KKQ52654.1 MAG: Protease HtpX-like protein [Parcubacteria group bacterium GW2011_GWD2_38_12]KKQ58828.1 MAG: Protease HtpX-like protein [Parcubacteria group bacterium GW2011_GWC1_38_17]KKQ59607.1 MAG: Protease HtpX-like protein [Parcubacteria group bacterium GW2011_GWD1_38_16]